MKEINSVGTYKTKLPICQKLYNQRFLFIMFSPAFLLTLVFNYLPIAGWYMAFVNYQIGFGMLQSKWVGLDNFKMFFLNSSDFIYIIRNTLVINIFTIIINLFAAFVFAILIKEIRSALFSRTMQMVSFFPFFISWVITYSVIYALFASESGAVNQVLVNIGVLKEGINLLGSSDYAWVLILSMNLWKYLGYNCIIFVAAIAGIPEEQYEAAHIDGADRFSRIRYITVPYMIPTLIILLIMNSGWILNSNFEQFFLFTNPTNWEKMEVFDMYIYKFGLELTNYSYATAVGIIRTIVSIAILITVNSISKKVSSKGIL